jgi:hypothetical protein
MTTPVQESLYPRITTINARGLTLEQRFEAFHAANPHVYASLRRLALDAARRGKQVGIKMLFEVLRWEATLATDDPASAYKLDNGYTSFYARRLMDNEPELAGFFETRTQRWMTTRSAA